jgi:mediator of RNA polymerase II transcription subunit 7
LNEELPSLEEQGIPQVYTPPATPTGSGKHFDRALILKRLAKSLLLNFLELVGIMSVNPEQVLPLTQQISNLLTLTPNI